MQLIINDKVLQLDEKDVRMIEDGLYRNVQIRRVERGKKHCKDGDDLNELGIALCLIANTKNVYISEKNKKQGIIKLLNSNNKNQIFDSIEDYSEYVIEGLDFNAKI